MAVAAARPFLSELGCLPVRQFVTIPFVSFNLCNQPKLSLHGFTKNEIRLKIKIFCFYSETLKNFFRDILLTVESGETSKARPHRSPRSPGPRRHRSTDDETGAVDLLASQF